MKIVRQTKPLCSRSFIFWVSHTFSFSWSICNVRFLTFSLETGKYTYRAFSLTWPPSMQIYWNKRKGLHKKRVQFPKDWFGTPTWPPFHCFGTPIRRLCVMWKHSIEQCTYTSDNTQHESALQYGKKAMVILIKICDWDWCWRIFDLTILSFNTWTHFLWTHVDRNLVLESFPLSYTKKVCIKPGVREPWLIYILAGNSWGMKEEAGGGGGREGARLGCDMLSYSVL